MSWLGRCSPVSWCELILSPKEETQWGTYTNVSGELRAWDGRVDVLAGLVVDQSKRSPSVDDGRVASCRLADAVDRVRVRRDLPEAVGGVDVRIPDIHPSRSHNIFVNVTEGVEGFSRVRIILVLEAAEVGGEDLILRLYGRLRDHVLDQRSDLRRSDSVDDALGLLSTVESM